MSKLSPLFLRWANSEISEEEVVRAFLAAARDDDTKKIIEDSLLAGVPVLEQFRSDFRNCLEDMIDNWPNRAATQYLTDYMSCSLLEYSNTEGHGRSGSEERWVGIKEGDAPWIEGLVCYNLSLYLKGFGRADLKKCPVCGTFFNHKGKHAKYCSDGCKQRGAR